MQKNKNNLYANYIKTIIISCGRKCICICQYIYTIQSFKILKTGKSVVLVMNFAQKQLLVCKLDHCEQF